MLTGTINCQVYFAVMSTSYRKAAIGKHGMSINSYLKVDNCTEMLQYSSLFVTRQSFYIPHRCSPVRGIEMFESQRWVCAAPFTLAEVTTSAVSELRSALRSSSPTVVEGLFFPLCSGHFPSVPVVYYTFQLPTELHKRRSQGITMCTYFPFV